MLSILVSNVFALALKQPFDLHCRSPMNHHNIPTGNVPRLASICSVPTPSNDSRSKNNSLMHLILSPPADGDLYKTTALHLGYVILSIQPSQCSMTFSLICSSRQSNAIINKDHKQVMAFIPLKFIVQKRSCCDWQHWLLLGGSFPHSLATR